MKNKFIPATHFGNDSGVTRTYEDKVVKGSIPPRPADPPLGKAQPGSWLAEHRKRTGKS